MNSPETEAAFKAGPMHRHTNHRTRKVRVGSPEPSRGRSRGGMGATVEVRAIRMRKGQHGRHAVFLGVVPALPRREGRERDYGSRKRQQGR